jgi:SAM-dependent methyltransferase
MAEPNTFSSNAYWEARYRMGGASGAGSLGRLAHFKAAAINRFIVANDVRSVIDLGCGDASQLALLELPADYIGVDVSATVLARCAALFPERRFVAPDELREAAPAELTLALDVVYHLIEDAVYAAFIETLFAWATRFVIIYASNLDAAWPAAHVRHRRFTDHVAATAPEWRLLAHLPNPYPYDPARPNDTSFADFFVYARRGRGCTIVVPDSA